MRYSDFHDDPFFQAMKRYERSVLAYSAIGVVFWVASLFLGSVNASNAGIYAQLVQPIIRFFEEGTMIGSGLAFLVAVTYLARLIYFFKWPERFYD